MNKIGEIMKEKKITTKELSELTGISSRTISEYRNKNRLREPSLSNGLKIADALKVDPHDLI